MIEVPQPFDWTKFRIKLATDGTCGPVYDGAPTPRQAEEIELSTPTVSEPLLMSLMSQIATCPDRNRRERVTHSILCLVSIFMECCATTVVWHSGYVVRLIPWLADVGSNRSVYILCTIAFCIVVSGRPPKDAR